MENLFELVPQNKFDNMNMGLLKEIDTKEAAPILWELLQWLQDINWPVAKELMYVLPRFHSELVPHIKVVLNSSDDIWKCWVLCLVKNFPKETVMLLEADIKRIVNCPADGELEENTDVYAREVARQFGFSIE